MTTRYYIAELKAAFDVTGMVVGSLRRDMDLGVPRVRVNEQCSCPSTPPYYPCFCRWESNSSVIIAELAELIISRTVCCII